MYFYPEVEFVELYFIYTGLVYFFIGCRSSND